MNPKTPAMIDPNRIPNLACSINAGCPANANADINNDMVNPIPAKNPIPTI